MDPYGNDPYAADLIAAMSAVPIQQQAVQARRRRAEALIGTPSAQGREVGRTYVASSPLEHLANGIARAMGYKQAQRADAELAPLADQARQAGLVQYRMDRGDKARAFGLQTDALERQKAADAAATADRKARLELDQQRAMSAEAEQAAAAQRAEREYALKERQLRQGKYVFPVDPVTGRITRGNTVTGVLDVVAPAGPGAPGPGSVPPRPKDLEDDVQKLGKDMEPLAKARADIDLLKSAADKGNVEGFGPVAGRMPGLVTGTEGVANRQAAGRLMAAIIQATSGQAASEKEVERLLEANGMGRTATDEQFRQGIAKLDAQYQGLTKEREAKYHPDVVNVYRQRGGYGSKRKTDDLRKKYGIDDG